jgi:hypothetical protein
MDRDPVGIAAENPMTHGYDLPMSKPHIGSFLRDVCWSRRRREQRGRRMAVLVVIVCAAETAAPSVFDNPLCPRQQPAALRLADE